MAWQRQDRPLPSNRTDGADDDRAAGVLPDRGGDEPRPVSASIAFRRRHVSWVAAAAVLTVTVLGAAWVIQTRPHAPDTSTEIDLPFEQDDYVLITQFDNLTGEPRFDGRGTLEAVLELALSESGYLHVVQPERIEDTLRLMTLPVDSVIDRTVGREVARRDGGIRAVRAGSIEASGSGYVLTVQLVNPQDGRVLDSVTEEASSDEAGIASAIRRQAGRGPGIPRGSSAADRGERAASAEGDDAVDARCATSIVAGTGCCAGRARGSLQPPKSSSGWQSEKTPPSPRLTTCSGGRFTIRTPRDSPRSIFGTSNEPSS